MSGNIKLTYLDMHSLCIFVGKGRQKFVMSYNFSGKRALVTGAGKGMMHSVYYVRKLHAPPHVLCSVQA